MASPVAPVSSTEQTPLLGNDRSPEHDDVPQSRTRRVAQWFTAHAVAICIGLLIAAVIVILTVSSLARTSSDVAKICLTPACVHASSEILYNLSPNYKEIDPCSNFEEFTCGGWSNKHDLRSDQENAFTGTIMSESAHTLLRHILESPYPKTSKHSSFSPAQLQAAHLSADQENFSKLKAAYDACIDEGTIKSKGIKPLEVILHKVAHLYPAKRSGSQSEGLADMMVFLTDLGVTSFLSIGAEADSKDPDVVIVSLGAPYEIGLPAKEYYEDEGVVAKYEQMLVNIFENMQSADYKGANASSVAHNIVVLEKRLAAASPDASDLSDITLTYNPMTIKQASNLTPDIQLGSIISSLAPPNVKTDRLIVNSPEYMRHLSTILSVTPRDVLQSYFQWKVIQEYSEVVEAEELKPYSRFTNVLSGKDPDSTSERWKTCVNHLNSAYDPNSGLGWILSRFYVEEAFSAKAKEFGDQVVTDIKDRFTDKLKAIEWMDEDTTKLAIDKVHQIVQKIGYPMSSPDIMNPEALRSFLDPVNINASTFFENALSMRMFGVKQEWATLGKPVDHDAWSMSIPVVNAYYNPPGNEIVFPAGIMQFPVFDVDLPQYLSYGAFGSVAGHELSHAFDSTGRHYDQNGNLTDWWSDDTVKGFTKRADCFVEQYHNYTIPGPNGKPLHVNGRLTLGENIADAGGVSAAFAAWKKRQAESEVEDLPGLEFFSQDQLFFVNYASWWCGKSRKESAIKSVYSDPHAPKFARIMGTMANSKDFKESFDCPSKKPVCELW
ncbi:peptidase family M13 [Calycina marina]|uniref:Peptidase family M13 n=1 Tax=Calycina marina TaxID=1763456 RepID=A0A9P8CEN0_9HELO|nr:peptidase family M13 [Calycina marina]